MTEQTHNIPALTEAESGPSTASCSSCSWSTDQDGVTVCSKFKKQISNTRLDDNAQELSYRAQANACGAWTTGRVDKDFVTSISDMTASNIAAFFPLALNADENNAKAGERDNCTGCYFFSPAGAEELGFNQTYYRACSARGLLLGNQHSNFEKTAKNCDSFRPHGGERFMTDFEYGISAVLLPVYNQDYLEREERKRLAEAPDAENVQPFEPSFEPSAYTGSIPVTDEFKAQGIRAWYTVKDPDGSGNSVLVPIFDRDFFPPSEQEKIPSSTDEERPQDYIDHQGLIYKILVSWNELDETPALIGPPGTGKTEVLRTIAWLMQLPFERISITGSTELDDLQGKMLFEDGQTVFKYGRLSAAWMKPSVICLDEPNVGPPEVWQFIRPLTDNSKQLVIDANKGERIYRNHNCFIGLAMNPAWDAKNVGAEFIADADSSRLLHIETELPPRDIEEMIIKSRCSLDGFDMPDLLLDTMFNISTDIRRMCDSGELPISWGVRSQIKVARLLKWFNIQRAYDMAGIGSLEPESRKIVTDLIRTRAGGLAERFRAVKAAKEKEARAEARADNKVDLQAGPPAPPAPPRKGGASFQYSPPPPRRSN